MINEINFRRVVAFAKASANLGLSAIISEKAVYVNKENASICDNYERFSSFILTYEGEGNWNIRSMYSDQEPNIISQEQAETEAFMMFYDGDHNEFVKVSEDIKKEIGLT